MGQTTRVKSLAPILVVLALATAYGLWYQRTRGQVRRSGQVNQGLTAAMLE